MGKYILPYIDSGKGPVVVLIHGFLENKHMWEDLLPELSREYRCICVDLPGHGENHVIDANESMTSMAEKVIALLGFLKIETFFCIGHSMGGYVGCELAQLIEDRLQSLILVSSHADGDDPEKKENRTRAEVVMKNKYESFIKEAIPGLFHPQNISEHQIVVDSYIKTALNYDSTEMVICSIAMKERLSSIEKLNASSLPVHFFCGDSDPIVPLNKVERQSTRIKNSRVVLIKNCGHMPHVEATKTLLSHIETGLRFQH